MPVWQEAQSVLRLSCPPGAEAVAPSWQSAHAGAGLSTASWCGLVPGALGPAFTPWQATHVLP